MLEYSVKPEIEVFDAAMLYNAKNMADRGLLKRPCQVKL
jgi:3-keto-5-aminohexanoate cleavage enzyme